MVGYRVGLAVALCALTGGFYLGNHQAASAAALPQTQVAQANTSAAPSGGTMDQRLDSLQKELDQ